MKLPAQSKNHYLNVKLLTKLGIKKPTQKHLALMNSLIFTVDGAHEILFSPNLTDREISCLRLIAQGKKANEIAKLLDLKKTTVDTHLKKIKRKTNSKTISQAVFNSMCLEILNVKNFKKTILLVEDEPITQKLHSSMLRDLGFKVDIAYPPKNPTYPLILG